MTSHRDKWNKFSVYVQAQPPPAALPLLQESATRFCLKKLLSLHRLEKHEVDSSGCGSRGFEHFERLVKEDVEKLKGEVDPPRILIPAAI